MENCIFLTGGGTAGHITVNISLQRELRKHFKKIVYIGSYSGIEKDLISQKTDYTYCPVTTVKLDRKNLIKDLLIPVYLCKGVSECKKLIKAYRPSVIFSKGGYVGLPVTIAGKKMHVPVVCHESDLSMGLSNKIAKKYAKKVCTNFEKTAKTDSKRCIYTGMPLNLSKLSKIEAKKKLGLNSDKPLLLIVGGSQGAKALNDFVYDNIKALTKDYFVFHITGKNNLKKIAADYYMQTEFCNNMPDLLRAADFAISRAGANTAFELLANNVLTIFVPLPKGSSRGDQVENSEYFKSNGLCEVISQNNLNLKTATELLQKLQKNAKSIVFNIKNADFSDGTDKIMKIILESTQQKQSKKP